MQPPREQAALRELLRVLADLLDFDPASNAVELKREPEAEEPLDAADTLVQVGPWQFLIEYKSSGAATTVANAIRQLREFTQNDDQLIPLVVVPFMGAVGSRRCEEAGIGWVDLSGNADITAPGVRVHVEGKPNRFKHPGRPSSAFAPKSSRIARWLLMHPSTPMSQREIAEATDMGEGFTSRIVRKLEEDELVLRKPSGKIVVRDPELLLDAWSEDYDFSKHRLLEGHIPSRTGEDLLRLLARTLKSSGIPHAATGLSAAWLLCRFAAFRLTTFYLAEPAPPELLEEAGFYEESRGANTWLVVPDDEGVFHGASELDGIRCVHPIQAWLDLEAHPERSADAADELRRQISSGWSDDR